MESNSAGFQLEFNKARFPLRFTLLTLTITAIAILFSENGDISIPMLKIKAVVLLAVLTAYCAVCMGVLRVFHGLIRSLRPALGMILTWFLIVAVSAVFCVALVFGTPIETRGEYALYVAPLTPSVGYSILLFATVLSPGLLWFEKRIFADKAALLASELEQFTNLDFRIRPHFLFNSLNSVASLIPQNPERAEKALYNLSDVFRAVMADKRQLVPLRAELDLAEKYLYLEKIRLGDRLEVISKIDSNALSIKVPVFLLQPLLENAVYHGIETRFQGGKVSLVIQIKDENLIIKITNPLPDAGVKHRLGNKVAQQNLRQRLHAVFGRQGSLDSYEAETSFNVVVQVPV